MSQMLEKKQKLMKSENIKRWVDVLRSDKDRMHHEETLAKCLFAPFLFGTSFVSDQWITWGVEARLFRNTLQPSIVVEKLEGPYFNILDTISIAFMLLCKKLKEFQSEAVDLQSVLIISEKTSKCSNLNQALCIAEKYDFFSKIKRQLFAMTNEKSMKTSMALIFAIKQYSNYVVESMVNSRNFNKEMQNQDPEHTKNFHKTEGNRCFKSGLFIKALNFYTVAINSDRFNHILYSNRAQTNLNLSKYQEALCDARRAVILKSDWPKRLAMVAVIHCWSRWWLRLLCLPEVDIILIYSIYIVLLLAIIPLNNPFKRRKLNLQAQGHYRYAQAFYELGQKERAKEVNRKGMEICRLSLNTAIPSADPPGGANNISYLQIQADRFNEKCTEEEDEVPELVEASSSGDSSTDSEDEYRQAERRKEELKQKRLAEEERRKKQEEAQKKKLMDEKKQKKAEKAEKKQRDEQKRQAEKAKREQIDAKHELEKMLELGSEAYLDKRRRQAVTFYQKAHELISQSSKKYGHLREEDYVTFLYAWGMAGLESGIAKEVHEAEQRFELMLQNHHNIRTPLAYYGIAYTYFKHCKFHDAFKPLDKAELMAKKFKYVIETWPGTNHCIEETVRGKMEAAIENLRDRCKNPPPADAVCRYGDCPSRREIYLTDPEFKGYVSTTCSEHCMIEYHVTCWEKARADWDGLIHDKDIIHKSCNTPDCLGDMLTLTIYGSDGFPRTEVKTVHAKKDKEKVKTKSKNKSKLERKRQKKQESKKNVEKGQGDVSERRESVSSMPGMDEELEQQLLMPKREKRDDDTVSTTSSNEVKRHLKDMEAGSASNDGVSNDGVSNDGDENSQEPDICNIDDILDDDLPLSIQDATYVLKREEFKNEGASSKKLKPAKIKTKKKKTKVTADLNIELQFVDERERSLMTSDDVLSPEPATGTPFYESSQDDPFAVPAYLREQAIDFERSLPPTTFSQTVTQTFAETAQTPSEKVATFMEETDEEKSQKMALMFHLSDLLDKLGPVMVNDPRLEMEMDKLADAQPVISRYGGFVNFLCQSKDFYVIEDHISLVRDSAKCHELFVERNNRLKEAGLPPPPFTGIGFGGQPQKTVSFSALSSPVPNLASRNFSNTGDNLDNTKQLKNTPGTSGIDLLDRFDLPSSGMGTMDDIDDINLTGIDNPKSKVDVVVSERNKLGAEKVNGSGWPQNQDLDQELDRVLVSQLQEGPTSLQSLARGQPFSTNDAGSFGLGVKSVSVDIYNETSYDSGLGSMQTNINKKGLQNDSRTNSNADVKFAPNTGIQNINAIADNSNGDLSAIARVELGGLSKSNLQTDQLVASPVSVSVTSIDCRDGDENETEIVRDVADCVDMGESVKTASSEAQSPMIPLDASNKMPLKSNVEQSSNGAVQIQSGSEPLAAEYQKLQARYKIVHTACKNFQEKRKNMKHVLMQTELWKTRHFGMTTEPFMEFEELKVTKERLQVNVRDIREKYNQLHMYSSSQIELIKTALAKSDAKEKELAIALEELQRQREGDLNKWQLEKTKTAEDLKARNAKIRELEVEKTLYQNNLAVKEHDLKELQRVSQIERDHWMAEKIKLQDGYQTAERNQKILTQRAMDAEILILQFRCNADTQAFENWLREAEFHLKNFNMNLNRAPENQKMKEGLRQWSKAVAGNNQKLENLKGKYEEQIRLIKGGRLLSQLPSNQPPQITIPSMPPPLPPTSSFMGPRPNFFPSPPSGIRPPLDINAPRPIHISHTGLSPSESPSLSPVPNLTVPNPATSQNGQISVPVSLTDIRSSSPGQSLEFSGHNTQIHTGPAKVTPAQVTVPLQEQAPWPPAALTPPHVSPKGFPPSVSQAAPPLPLPSLASNAVGSLGAVGTRPLSVAGANAAPGNNRPRPAQAQVPAPVAVAQTIKPVSSTAQPRSNFERILFPLQTLFPQHNQLQLTKAIKEVRQANNGSLSGLSVDEIIRRSASILKHQPPMRPPAGVRPSAGVASGSASAKSWQVAGSNKQQVPQGQRLVQGVMQGIAAQQAKFQWPSEYATHTGLMVMEDDPCVICHEEMLPETTKVLECGHRFHAECIKQWLNEQSTCPNCRSYTLLPDEYPSLH